MTSFTRSALTDFDFGIPVYAGATVSAWTVDTFGNKTAFLATLYADLTSTATLSNPQTLDGFGKWVQPIYINAPVILTVTGANGVPDHQTGVISANLAGSAATDAAASASQAAGFFGAASDTFARVKSVYSKFLKLGFPISLVGKALSFMRVNAGESAYEFRTPAQTRADIAAAGTGVANTMTGSLTMSGAAINEAAATVASAATTDLGAATGNCIDISGTTTITGFGTVQSGTRRQCRITNASGLTLTHSGTLICPGSVSLVLAQFDQFEAESYGSGTWVITKVLRAGGDPVMGWATKATQQTGTDAVRSVTAAQQHQHPSALKGYGIVASAGSAVVGGYPSSASSVKNGTGDYTITHGRSMANTNYPASATTETAGVSASIVSRTTTQLQVLVTTTSTGAAVDANVDYWIAGTLA